MTDPYKNNKSTRRDRLRLLVAGMDQHLQGITSVTFGGVVHLLPDIKAKINADIAASDLSEQGHAVWLQQVEAERASHAAVDPLVSGVRQLVRLQIGDTDAVQGTLGDFGMSPTRRSAPTPATKAAAAVKAKATRAARGTRGPVARKAIKGAEG